MITFEQISALFSFNTQKKFCVEILFKIDESEKFDWCWMGKLWSDNESKDVYWYGLTEDGNGAYDFDTFEEMSAAPVFDGLNLKEVWPKITIQSIDGCDPLERLSDYLGDDDNMLMLGTPQ